ncbi:hypothetical protein ACP5PY_03625 [Photobacterium leiognathi subsp. mandapamensis]
MRIVSALIVSSLLFSTLPIKASEADCSIWLCLPMGFPSGCSDAKSAFKHRIKKFKPPLPNFLSCLATDVQVPTGTPVSTMDTKYGVAAIMNYSKQCTQYEYDNQGQQHCVEYGMLPNNIVKDTRCYKRIKDGDVVYWNPRGCIGTTNWVETYMDGKRYGDRFYY